MTEPRPLRPRFTAPRLAATAAALAALCGGGSMARVSWEVARKADQFSRREDSSRRAMEGHMDEIARASAPLFAMLDRAQKETEAAGTVGTVWLQDEQGKPDRAALAAVRSHADAIGVAFKKYRRERILLDYYHGLAGKYRAASRHPWTPLTPDPPAP